MADQKSSVSDVLPNANDPSAQKWIKEGEKQGEKDQQKKADSSSNDALAPTGGTFLKSLCGDADVPPGQTTVQCQTPTKAGAESAAKDTVKSLVTGGGNSSGDSKGSTEFGGPPGNFQLGVSLTVNFNEISDVPSIVSKEVSSKVDSAKDKAKKAYEKTANAVDDLLDDKTNINDNVNAVDPNTVA